jgi:hypothetical protein
MSKKIKRDNKSKSTTKGPDEPNGSSEPGQGDEERTSKKGLQLPYAERVGRVMFNGVQKYIKANNGTFLRAQDRSLHLILNQQRIALDFNRDNDDLARIFLRASQVSTASAGGQVAIQRLRVLAADKASNIVLKRFSAVSDDGERIYVPVADGQLLCVTAEAIRVCPNGTNDDRFWIEHPRNDAFIYKPEAGPAALSRFKELLVDTQACTVPQMRWFVALNEALLTFIRNLVPARFITVHEGPSQSGKTSGAERFYLLHGLGHVKGDYTPAAYASLGDEGLLVLDNKEHSNLTRALIDLLLFYATGAERGRSSGDGHIRRSQEDRPVVVVTSIEGMLKTELLKRCVGVKFGVAGPKLPRRPIETAIQKERHEICSALMLVLQEYLRLESTFVPVASPLPDFEEHFTALCKLLHAYGKVSGRPEEWANGIIRVWCDHVRPSDAEEDTEDDLETLILQFLDQVDVQKDTYPGPANQITRCHETWQGRTGMLFIMRCETLLTGLQRVNLAHLDLPKTSSALGRRIRSAEFSSLAVLDDDNAPDIEELERHSKKRVIGIFRVDDGMTGSDATYTTPVIGEPMSG